MRHYAFILFLLFSSCSEVPWVDVVIHERSELQLPHHEITSRTEESTIWFDLDAKEYRSLKRPTLYVTRASSNLMVAVDDTWVFGSFDDRPMRHTWNTPLLVPLPVEALQRGDKIRLGLFSFRGDHQILEPFVIGEYPELEVMHRWQHFAQIDLTFAATIIAFVFSLLFLILFMASSGERVFLFAAGGQFFYAVANLNFHVSYQPISHGWWQAIAHISLDWYAVISAFWLFAYREYEPPRWFVNSAISWLVFCTLANVVVPSAFAAPYVEWAHAISLGGFFVALGISSSGKRHPDFDRFVIGLALLIGGVFCIVDMAIQFRWISAPAFPRLTPLAIFAIVLSASMVLFRQFLRTFREARRSNEELAEIVRTKEEEIKRQHEALRKIEADVARSQERSEIMRELHDGMGGQLVSALALSEREAGATELPDALRGALQEMRFLLNTSRATEDVDLGTLLGSLREQLEGILSRAGMNLVWKVDPFATFPDLSPKDQLQVTRIVQESVTNAIKHSGGDQVQITAVVEPILKFGIQDNGGGGEFSATGNGLTNIRARAEEIGATATFNGTEDGTLVEVAWVSHPYESGDECGEEDRRADPFAEG